MHYTWIDATIAAAWLLTVAACATAHLAWRRRRRARDRDLERTLRVARYAEPPRHVDLTLAWAHHNALLLRRLGALGYLGYVATRRWHFTMPPPRYRHRDDRLDALAHAVHSHHLAGPAMDIAT